MGRLAVAGVAVGVLVRLVLLVLLPPVVPPLLLAEVSSLKSESGERVGWRGWLM